MTVLYISNRYLISKSEAFIWFKFYCEKKDFHIRTNLEDAKKFLMEQIIKEQKHIDFIITDWKFGFSNAKILLSWLRESKETYSSRNFQFRSIPVLLIEDTDKQSSFISEGFDGVVKEFPANHLRFRQSVRAAIKAWRYSLADDLDLIGLDPKTQIIYQNHRSNFISYYRLKVLSRQFVDNKSKRLNYIWTKPKNIILRDSNQAFSDKMSWAVRTKPKYMEKEFHQFFLLNPTFIKGELFSSTKEEMLYERHLYKNGTLKYDEPDFLNKPLEYALRSPEVFEIKRQTQKLIRYGKQNFISNARKSFEQVLRYKEYLTSTNPMHQKLIVKYLGKVFNSYEYTLLMGSADEKFEHFDLITQLKDDYKFNDITLLTYEELLDRHIRLCDRLEEYNIF